jgi:protein-tyrosine phosphatase
MLARLFSREKLKLSVDVHSHLLPGLDDGVKSFDEAIEILERLQLLGYKKAITTPHIYPEVYPNTPEEITSKFQELESLLKAKGLTIQIAFAAEYFMDHSFLEGITKGGKILTFDNKYVLFETPFYSKPLIFDEVIFQLKAKGYVPVLAHPERYHYFDDDLNWLQNLSERGVLFQVNLPSIEGVYGEEVKKRALKMIKESKVHFFGSDIHRLKQLPVIEKVLKMRLDPTHVLNNSLMRTV